MKILLIACVILAAIGIAKIMAALVNRRNH